MPTSPMPAPRPGALLVATPALQDPNFTGSVVLLVEADADGALGVILNRPSSVPVSDVLDQWSDLAAGPEVLFRGGPVGLDGALGLAWLSGNDGSAANRPLGYREVEAGVGIIDLDTPVNLVTGALRAVRIFAGYAGWDADQLRGEIKEGSWYVVPSAPADVFGADPESLRRDVLRRQPGELAWRSTQPRQPELN